MSNPIVPEEQTAPESVVTTEATTTVLETTEAETNGAETTESFGSLLSEFEQSHRRRSEDGSRQIDATVIAVNAESVFVDIGYKTEGILPLTAFGAGAEPVQPGDKLAVSVKGRDEDGYYEVTLHKVARPKDWSSLEEAFAAKAIVSGTVTGVVKGGLTVDIGTRAFMPASRSGVRDAAEMEKLVGVEIRCRITKLDVADEDVVVDRRAVVEEEERQARDERYSQIRENEIVTGTVRSLTEYGAFVDLGGADGLLHISDIGWHRVEKPSDVLEVGQRIEAKVLKVDAQTQKISLGMKQLLAHPWDAVPEKFHLGDRVTGVVTRTTDFGAFVELEPGVEGLVHVSEMSWAKKVRKGDDMVKAGETVEVVILGIDMGAHRMSLGLKQALGDPWAEAPQKFPVGAEIEGPVTTIMKFGAFVQLAEGVEGMVHISEIVPDRRLNHPSDVLRVGERVKALVLEIDREKRQVKLSMKQLIPTGLDEFVAEHGVGDAVSGRIVDVTGGVARVELGEGIFASCVLPVKEQAAAAPAGGGALDLSSLTSMLNAKWKGSAASAGGSAAAASEEVRAGQIRSFKIAGLDVEAKKIELTMA
jgi:small subunit ribosomal protein S1